jgi:uncharacterized protein (UPF0333 family)
MIKRIVFFSMAVAFVAFSGLASVQPVAAASANAAVVINDSGCFMFDNAGFLTYTTDGQIISTQSGVDKVTCKANITGIAKTVIRWNYDNTGAYCFTTYGVTQNWQEIITPSGRAILSCHSNP